MRQLYIFDLDGVVTDTAKLHFSAWKKMYEEFSYKFSAQNYDFNSSTYDIFFDGKPRETATLEFYNSLGISLNQNHLQELTNYKNSVYIDLLSGCSPTEILNDGFLELYQKLKVRGHQLALATSSKNCSTILSLTKLENAFDYVIDGKLTEILNLPGKPHPEIFNKCIDKLNCNSASTVIIEDSINGILAAVRSEAGTTYWLSNKDLNNNSIPLEILHSRKIKKITNLNQING